MQINNGELIVEIKELIQLQEVEKISILYRRGKIINGVKVDQ